MNSQKNEIETYISKFPDYAQKKLKELYNLLRGVAPEAEALIKWGKPAFVHYRILFSFSAAKSHLTFVPTGPSLAPFRSELEGYVCGKDSIQFPYNLELPKNLIEKIAKHRYQAVLKDRTKWKY